MNNSTLAVRVARRRIEADGIVSLELVDANGGELPAFDAGAHIDVHVPGGLVRQYSLCNPPWERNRYQIAVLRDPASRGGSIGMHDAVAEGDTLQISAPRNHFPLAQGAVQHVLFAGGIGLTPLLCMAQHLARQGETFTLHYCARSSSRAAFVEQIQSAEWAGQVRFHFDDLGQQLDLDALLAQPQANQHLYVCGPQGFMDWVLGQARTSGWKDDHLHFEYFSAAAPVALDSDASFEVEIASTGQVVVIPPDLPITQALYKAGVDVMVSCEQGICGTCMTRVISGEPDHRDLYMTPEEHERNDQILPCCSRSKSPRLVLDL